MNSDSGRQIKHDALVALEDENARLIALLEVHGIEWRRPPLPPHAGQHSEPSRLTTEKKVALFRRLFRGRIDAYPVRWESKTTGKSGYAPACANEWRPGVCEKPRIKCSECGNRQLLAVTDSVIYKHLTGEHTVGIYPLLEDDACFFVAVDFDEAEWRADALAYVQSCNELGVPVALEISRSGKGAHAWIFFTSKVMARDARRLCTAIISHACSRTRQLKLTSYDRLFPNQDTMPKGGFGNLITLPLQRVPRDNGHSVFADSDLQPHPDQWAFLAALTLMPPLEIEPTILRATGGVHPLDVTFIDHEDLAVPWQRPTEPTKKLAGPLPKSLTITLANLIYFEKAALPPPLANRLIRLAAFQNPEFYKAQAMRMSVWDKPRVIGCADNYPEHIALPRGCLDGVRSLMADHDIGCDLHDERLGGTRIDVKFAGTLRADQETAVVAMLGSDIGILCALTAFGKTVVAAAMIARRGANALVLVHRTELLKQWKERLQTFLGIDRDVIGSIGGGMSSPTGKIDIAVMQSLWRKGEVDPLVETYGHIVVDECHHIGAASFDAILKRVKARFVLGLTATPIRRDGLQPIIFMQCGPIRHTAAKQPNAPMDLVVRPCIVENEIDVHATPGIQDVFRLLAEAPTRTTAIASAVKSAHTEGRKVLVLTERTEHLGAIRAALHDQVCDLFVLHGRMSKRQRAGVIAGLNSLPESAPRILLATGKLVGEGFDHAPLDTLVLAMPISWKGTLQQYAGRLHRECVGKTNVRIIDFVDMGHPALLRMWERRQKGYRLMGYRIDQHVDTKQAFQGNAVSGG